jgi:hypothetical protein
MYHLNIEIKEIDQQIKLIYLPGQLDEILKEQIKQYKKGILKRIEENEAAKRAGFLVYNHGLIYEYRYGLGAFIFIERHPNGLVSVWRENYLPDQNKPFKTKIMVENVSFKKGFENAQGFINWLKKRR